MAAWSLADSGGSVDLHELGGAVVARAKWLDEWAAVDPAAAGSARGAWLLVEVVERLEAADRAGAGDLLASYARVVGGQAPAWEMLGADDWEDQP